jgi:hypothetical protein
LAEFAARVARLHRRRIAVQAALRAALWLALPLLGLLVVAPARGGLGAAVCAAAVALAALRVWFRQPELDPQAALALRAATGAFGDEFATWLEWRAAAAPFRPWLGRDLQALLPALPLPALRSIGRRPWGRLRWLAVVVLALWLAWLLLVFWQPPWAGALGGRPEAAAPPPPSGAAPSEAQPRPGADRQVGTEPQPTPTPEPQPAGEPRPEPAPEPTPSAEPAAPLLDIPGAEQFVVPEHIADGPTTRVRMRAAEAPEPGPGAAAAAARGSAGGGADASVPPPAPETFARAAEAAAAARHVPAAERPLVQRYFQWLREAAR